ncbi:regulator of cell morphogenesis and NO signaling [Saccharicrinis carchari]|uniref:Regulator of cell morphogenesis and NO signaling n=1 Tax=Saccharicrinis carchari TaxID=1168039 RepID=A0A521E0A3_SACCC|nr:iron-sulfur cluster repair di-iron protein [Saccharicrinis carchari]SMO77275.1 regulator of cell morphogenesis and NO signaling [Saccharicrinis carchari]
MEIKLNTRVGDIVKANYKTAQLFDKNKIDFCCGGGITLEEACKKSGADLNALVPELEAMLTVKDPDSKYIDGMELDELCDYIEKRHHTYVSDNIPFLKQKLEKLCNVHGGNHPELFEVKELFDVVAGNLTMHMQKEEILVFPLIRKLVKLNKESADFKRVWEDAKKNIALLDEEHQAEGERLVQISELTSTYTPPADGCTTYRITYQTLSDFEKDLHRHIHLENNILFVKALQLNNKKVSQ